MNDIEWFEIKAEAFRLCTGHMAPGKDPASATYPAPFEERVAAWEKWTSDNLRIIAAFGSAFRAVMGGEGS